MVWNILRLVIINSQIMFPKYGICRDWIQKSRAQGLSWEKVFLARKDSIEELSRFLKYCEAEMFWPHVSVDDWEAIVRHMKTEEESGSSVGVSEYQDESRTTMCTDESQDELVSVPGLPKSSWQLYRRKLIDEKHFQEQTVDAMEHSTLRLLQRLHKETTRDDPVKGAVIGNVQSGKTANMAALMAMAADWGYNMFIVLSGTIENLRVQTQNRLFSDLNSNGNILCSSKRCRYSDLQQHDRGTA